MTSLLRSLKSRLESISGRCSARRAARWPARTAPRPHGVLVLHGGERREVVLAGLSSMTITSESLGTYSTLPWAAPLRCPLRLRKGL